MSLELSPLEAFERYAALGPDFLTWLLCRVLDDDVPPPNIEQDLKVDIQGPLLVEGEGGEAQKVTLTGEEAAASPEVRRALREGKKLKRAKVVFNANEVTWTFTLQADTFEVKSAKLPVPPIPDINEMLSMRIQSTLHLYSMLDDMFENFLAVRLSPDAWKTETERMRRWAE